MPKPLLSPRTLQRLKEAENESILNEAKISFGAINCKSRKRTNSKLRISDENSFLMSVK